MTNNNYDRVKKEYFRDIETSKEEILSTIEGKNKREKQFVFEKILLNSTKMFMDLKYFAKDELDIEDRQDGQNKFSLSALKK